MVDHVESSGISWRKVPQGYLQSCTEGGLLRSGVAGLQQKFWIWLFFPKKKCHWRWNLLELLCHILFYVCRYEENTSNTRRVCETASVTPFLVVTRICCTWASIINLNTCHAGIVRCETTASLLVFKYECHSNDMDIAKMEDNLSGAHSENTDFIMEIALRPNWHNEVNQKDADICSAS